MKPIFPNCAFPDDCQCAARGYEHERDECAVPGLMQFTSAMGIPTDRLFGRNEPVLRTREQIIRDRDEVRSRYQAARAATLAKLMTAAENSPVTLDAALAQRWIDFADYGAGLRAEAGVGGGASETLYSIQVTVADAGLKYLDLSLIAGQRNCWRVFAMQREFRPDRAKLSFHSTYPEALAALEAAVAAAGGATAEPTVSIEELPEPRPKSEEEW